MLLEELHFHYSPSPDTQGSSLYMCSVAKRLVGALTHVQMGRYGKKYIPYSQIPQKRLERKYAEKEEKESSLF